MSDIRSSTIAIISQGSYNDRDTPRSISLIVYFFNFCSVFIESSSSAYSSIYHIRAHTIPFCTVDSIMERSIDTRISSFLSSDRDEFGVDIIDFGFCFITFFFGSSDCRSASHSCVVVKK